MSEVKKLIRIAAVKNLTGISKSHIYLLASKGDFPKPIKLGERSVAWVQEEVETWIENRISQRDGEV
ncbi:MAG: AlpA family transcriptional regulator [Methyloprofundus sp.]|nr:AlpA family transcriptional regulator [Methyloprofundus sp.]